MLIRKAFPTVIFFKYVKFKIAVLSHVICNFGIDIISILLTQNGELVGASVVRKGSWVERTFAKRDG